MYRTLQLSLRISAIALFAVVAPHAFAADRVHVSHNWAGYEVTGDTYTGVSGSWVIPEATEGGQKISAHTEWVGIGGATTKDLIQAGTQAIVIDGTPVYHAWYETLPDTQRELPLKVSPGDTVSVSLTETTPDNWLLVFTNATTGKTYSSSIAYHSSHSSAEWIIERPSAMRENKKDTYIDLNDFDTITFSKASTTQKSLSVPLSKQDPEQIIMQGSTISYISAAPAATKKESFTVKYYTKTEGRKFMHKFRQTHRKVKVSTEKVESVTQTLTPAADTTVIQVKY